MKLDKIEATIEAVLFSVGDAVPIHKLADVIGQNHQTTKKIINNMADHYENEGRGIRIIELDGSYQLCTKHEFYDVIKIYTDSSSEVRLSDVLIETLSIVAYKQPITRAHIEEIRGVNSNHAVNKLIEYKLIHEVGRLDAPGKPILFGTTKDFLRGFGLQSIAELPTLQEEQMTKLHHEVQHEVQLKLED